MSQPGVVKEVTREHAARRRQVGRQTRTSKRSDQDVQECGRGGEAMRAVVGSEGEGRKREMLSCQLSERREAARREAWQRAGGG